MVLPARRARAEMSPMATVEACASAAVMAVLGTRRQDGAKGSVWGGRLGMEGKAHAHG
jgi:hypothetical protein